MSKPRPTLWGLMASVVLFALAFAALRNPTPASAGWMFLGTLGTLLFGFVGVVSHRGRTRLGWLGFVLFGWSYLILNLIKGDVKWLMPPFDDFLADAFTFFHPQSPQPDDPSFIVTPKTTINWNDFPYFLQIGQLLFTLLFGVFGAVFARFFGTKPTETHPTGRK